MSQLCFHVGSDFPFRMGHLSHRTCIEHVNIWVSGHPSPFSTFAWKVAEYGTICPGWKVTAMNWYSCGAISTLLGATDKGYGLEELSLLSGVMRKCTVLGTLVAFVNFSCARTQHASSSVPAKSARTFPKENICRPCFLHFDVVNE